jgi:AAA domain/Family of unknown function (DUF5681)
MGVTCIDLDVKPDTSAEERSRHDAIVEQFDTYTERSQSGNGMHLWCMGKIGRGRKRDGIEVYSQERFIACTGNVVQHRLIADRKELLTNMVAQMPEKAADTVLADDRAAELSDNALWDRAHAASNAQKFRDLCAGNWTKYGFPSQSEADLALMSIFTFYSRNNEQCRRLFRCTQLGARAKAQDDDRHLDYMLKLIRARQAREDERGRGAAADGARFADNLTRAKASPASADTWSIVSVADVATNPAPPPEFLIEDLLPAREVTLLPADGGAGKSLLTLIAAVCQAMGMPFMGKRVTRCKVNRGRFLPGTSGNPRGRKAGVPNKRSPLEARIAEHGEAIMDKVIEAALDGDLQAAGIALQRISPSLKARAPTVTFELDCDATYSDQASAVLSAVARGEVDPETGRMLIDCISAAAGLRRFDDFAEQLELLRQSVATLEDARSNSSTGNVIGQLTMEGGLVGVVARGGA